MAIGFSVQPKGGPQLLEAHHESPSRAAGNISARFCGSREAYQQRTYPEAWAIAPKLSNI